MSLSHVALKKFLQAFEREGLVVVRKLDRLREVINNLRFEGKVFAGKNIKEIEIIVGFLKARYAQHVKIDDHVVFPFVERHIPRLEPVLNFLRAERKEFKATLEAFEALYARLKNRRDDAEYYKMVEKLTDKIIYLVGFIRNHIQMEKEGVYKIIEQELRVREKQTLSGRIEALKNRLSKRKALSGK